MMESIRDSNYLTATSFTGSATTLHGGYLYTRAHPACCTGAAPKVEEITSWRSSIILRSRSSTRRLSPIAEVVCPGGIAGSCQRVAFILQGDRGILKNHDLGLKCAGRLKFRSVFGYPHRAGTFDLGDCGRRFGREGPFGRVVLYL